MPTQKSWTAAFFTLWTGQAFSLLGSQLVQFALIWRLTQETGSATVLATASLAGMLPQVLLGPIVGPIVDRYNRRRIMIAADAVIAAATALLALLFLLGRVEIWHIYGIMFVRSLAGGFHWPAMTASTSLIVPKEHLARIQGLNQMLHGGMNILSAPLGALLLSYLSIQGILAIDLLTAALAIATLLLVHIPQPVLSAAQSASTGLLSLWEDFVEGLRYMLAWPGLVLLLLMGMLINLLMFPAFSLLPILVANYFNGQAMQLGLLNATLGIGMIAGGLLLSLWGGFKRRVLTTLAGLVGLGLAILVIAFAPAHLFLLAVLGMFLTGAMMPIVNGPIQAVIQSTAEPHMQGRIFTLIASLSGLMAPLGLIIAGPIADRLGVQAWFFIGGLFCLFTGLAGNFFPSVAYIESGGKKPAAHAALPGETPAL